MNNALALVVDDEADILDLITITLARMDVSARTAGTVAEAKAVLASERFDLCMTDMRLPDGDGIDLVHHINAEYPDLPVAMITAYGNMELAVRAMKAGAFDFVSKPVDLAILRKLVTQALKLRLPITPSEDLESTGQLLGESDQMQEIRHMIGKLARNQAPVFIAGESGTGKELAARSIHMQGPRADQPFVPVNCGAIPQDLVESELFGHRKGSFTGAVADKEGLFQAADSGTLFLDEVADLPLSMQVKLLRAIQEKSVRRIGDQKESPVDARIISASHKDLEAEVDNGAFRQDLFYRINVIDMRMPPLRERPEDIPELADHILSRIALETGREPQRLTDGALRLLKRHKFPGNVRELENILERAIALCDATVIDAEDLRLPSAATASTPSPGEKPEDDKPLEDRLEEMEKLAILKALDETHWNRTAAAKKLGMTPRSLRYRLSKLGLD